jgi:hypothetical protein
MDPDRIYEATITAAKEWSVADAEARKLKALERIILSEITNRMEGNSFAEKKSKALASPEYRLHIDRMIAARTQSNLLKAKLEAVKDLSNNRRTQEVTHRTEMGIR